MSDARILDLSQLATAPQGMPQSVATVGVFDGVHLGHRTILARLVERARWEGCRSAVVTFAPHPRNVLRPEAAVASVSSLDERIEALHACGVDEVVVLRFDRDLATLPAGDFVASLHKSLAMRGLMVGHDFALGKGREGTAEVLAEIGRRLGFWVEEAPALACGPTVISSTAIRQAVGSGDVATAGDYLGRPFSIDAGPAVAYNGASAEFHVPPPQLVPESGIYRTKALIGGRPYASQTSVDRGDRFLKVALPGIAAFLQSHLRVQFLGRLEESRRAQSLAAV